MGSWIGSCSACLMHPLIASLDRAAEQTRLYQSSTVS
jgi:hypothetical protein